MKETPKISVVLPVYNVENYIGKCIESLKAQTFKELEFIVVDDCSPDDSMRPVREWADSDPRVRILRNEENSGEGASRNRGMDAARGLYVNNIDPDDWVAPDFYELLWAKAVETSADIVKGTIVKISEETGREAGPGSDLNSIITEKLDKGEPLYLYLSCEHQTIIIKRVLLEGGAKYGRSGNAADTTFLLRLCSQPVTFVTENSAYYYYLQRKTSATGEYSLKRSRNELISMTEQIDHFLQWEKLDKYVYFYCSYRYSTYASGFISACENEVISTLENRRYISDLKAQLTRLPDYEKLYEINIRIKAFIEMDIILANQLDPDISVCRDEVHDWMTFISALVGVEKRKASKKFRWLLKRFVKDRIKDGASIPGISRELLDMGSMLNWKQKMRYYRIILGGFFRYFLHTKRVS